MTTSCEWPVCPVWALNLGPLSCAPDFLSVRPPVAAPGQQSCMSGQARICVALLMSGLNLITCWTHVSCGSKWALSLGFVSCVTYL